MVLKKAVARQGLVEYPLYKGDFPVYPSLERIKQGLTKQFPYDSRVEDLAWSQRPYIEGFCEAAICYHFPDWSVMVEYS